MRCYPDGWGDVHPLTGLMYCADCGGKRYVHRINNGKRVPHYTCAEYSKVPVGVRCNTQHRIKADAVLSLIADRGKPIYWNTTLHSTDLLLSEKLYPHLLEIDQAANERLALLTP